MCFFSYFFSSLLFSYPPLKVILYFNFSFFFNFLGQPNLSQGITAGLQPCHSLVLYSKFDSSSLAKTMKASLASLLMESYPSNHISARFWLLILPVSTVQSTEPVEFTQGTNNRLHNQSSSPKHQDKNTASKPNQPSIKKLIFNIQSSSSFINSNQPSSKKPITPAPLNASIVYSYCNDRPFIYVFIEPNSAENHPSRLHLNTVGRIIAFLCKDKISVLSSSGSHKVYAVVQDRFTVSSIVLPF